MILCTPAASAAEQQGSRRLLAKGSPSGSGSGSPAKSPSPPPKASSPPATSPPATSPPAAAPPAPWNPLVSPYGDASRICVQRGGPRPLLVNNFPSSKFALKEPFTQEFWPWVVWDHPGDAEATFEKRITRRTAGPLRPLDLDYQKNTATHWYGVCTEAEYKQLGTAVEIPVYGVSAGGGPRGRRLVAGSWLLCLACR